MGSFIFAARSNTLRMPEASRSSILSAIWCGFTSILLLLFGLFGRGFLLCLGACLGSSYANLGKTQGGIAFGVELSLVSQLGYSLGPSKHTSGSGQSTGHFQ